ncbi:MAG: transcriptional regulator GlxA family with amidase domain [Gammaproteobacteria bacterium]
MDEIAPLFPPPPPPPEGLSADLSVGIILAPHFTILPFAGFIDSLRHASDIIDHSRQIYCAWTIIAHAIEPIRASCGLEVLPQTVLPDVDQFDYLVIVGGYLPWCLNLHPESYDYIQQATKKSIPVIGLCTGSFILARAGLLDKRRCCVHPEHQEQFNQLFPTVETITDQPFVIDNGVITCPGGIASLELAFSLVETHCGKARAIKGLKSLLVTNHRLTEHILVRPYEQLSSCGNRRVEKAVELMELNFSAPYPIAKLARIIGISVRELNRAFIQHAGEPPSAVWRNIRLAHAHWLLINSSRTVTEIAFECGFADSPHFSRWFKKTYDETPNDFRSRRRDIK